MSESNRPRITEFDVREELLLACFEEAIRSTANMADIGKLLSTLCALGYVNVHVKDRAVWLAALFSFLEAMPGVIAKEESRRLQPNTERTH